MAMSAKSSSSRSAMLFKRAALACTLATLLSGCEMGSDLDDDEETFRVRTLNLIEDSATLNVLLGDTTIASIDYGGASAFSAAHPGATAVSFRAVLPATFDTEDDDDDPMNIGQSQSQAFLKDTPYT